MSEENAIDINIEQILAAVLATTGEVSVTVSNLTADYGEYSVAVNQDDDGNILFSLVKVNDES